MNGESRDSDVRRGQLSDDGVADLRFESPPYGVVPVTHPDTTVGEIREGLVGHRFESIAYVVACVEDRPVGLARLEDVFAAPAATPLREVMDPDPPVIEHGTDEEVAAWKAVRHGESALIVVDEERRFRGLISPRRMVEVLLNEHDEDLARLGGYAASTMTARHATEEPVGQRFVHRLPWLLFGLCGVVASAGIVNAFEHDLNRNVLVAFFVPGIVYMADAVGTQTESLVIRGLSVGVPVGRIVRRELLTGLLVGVAIAAVFLPVALALWGEADVALAGSLALLAACSTATIVAMALPWALNRLGTDPAFGSGPLATVVQDLLSLLIYFWIVSAIVI